MKEIKLTKNKIAFVDEDDFLELSIDRWMAKKINGIWYAYRIEKGKMVLMHRKILNDTKYPQVDHIDGNGLNNQKHNLRPCTHSQNQMNSRIRTDNKSGEKGVHWSEGKRRWIAQIRNKGKRIYLGCFIEKCAAVYARKEAERKYHGDFARKGET